MPPLPPLPCALSSAECPGLRAAQSEVRADRERGDEWGAWASEGWRGSLPWPCGVASARRPGRALTCALPGLALPGSPVPCPAAAPGSAGQGTHHAHPRGAGDQAGHPAEARTRRAPRRARGLHAGVPASSTHASVIETSIQAGILRRGNRTAGEHAPPYIRLFLSSPTLYPPAPPHPPPPLVTTFPHSESPLHPT